MPTYVYRRPDGTVFETFQKISDPPLTTDPETGVPVERVISGGAGLQFKGSGFYLTDYGRGGQPTAKDGKGADAPAKADGASGKAAKADAPATPAPSAAPDTKA